MWTIRAVCLLTSLIVAAVSASWATESSADIPARDPISLATRFLGAPSSVDFQPMPSPTIGETRSFFVLDQATSTYGQVEATNVYASQHAFWWVQNGVAMDQQAIPRTAATFESRTLDVLERLFGSLSFPDTAGEHRAHVLNARSQGIGAYFSSIDVLPRSIHQYSNEIPLIVMNVNSFTPGSSAYDETLAHETQHMLHWAANPSSETWFDEGVSEVVASAVRGSPARGSAFSRQPDRSLMAWTDETGAFAAQYDGSYLFAQYLADRFGLDALGTITRIGRPPASILSFLVSQGQSEQFDELYGDWLVANLKDPRRSERPPLYRYNQAEPDAAIVGQLGPGSDWADAVKQYGTDYLEIQPGVTSLEVQSDSAVRIAPASGASDDLVWWGNRADSMDATLTHAIDLRQQTSAAVSFRTWFNTEQDFDHGYVAVSTDAGSTWHALAGLNTRAANPTGNAYGPSFTGRSGTGNAPDWVREQIDLSAYAGSEILLRFEYITDQGTTRQGWIIDDIDISGAGIDPNSELDQASWQAAGFVRTPLTVDSRMLIQVISGEGAETAVSRVWIDAGTPTVVPMPDSNSRGTVVTVSGVTPSTFEEMSYQVHAAP
jgi:hypothetical protein